jgi:orotidine-5'-phosphate decarboxylase
MDLAQARDKLILALDVADIPTARALVRDLKGVVGFFKLGLVLQLAPGAQDFLEELLAAKKRVFLDYKYHDIPATVRKAVERASTLGVELLTIHGYTKVMQAAVAGRSGKLKLFAVTVLTSMDQSDIAETGYEGRSVEDLVLIRARKALEAGCNGVIASGQEARAIKDKVSKDLLVITPGIRPAAAAVNDQKRAVTPAQAIRAGADYLVIGRPITQPDHGKTPRQAAEAILAEIQSSL